MARKKDNTFLYLAAIAAAYFAFRKTAINGIGAFMEKRKRIPGQNKYMVTYDKKVGGEGYVVVVAYDDESAINAAYNLTFTGKNFRNPVIVDWDTESAGGNTRGRQRSNY
jgi:hypothetical protein